MAKWVDDVAKALTNLGGTAHCSQICEEVLRIRVDKLPVSWRQITLKMLVKHSSDSRSFDGDDLFHSVEGLGKGIWRLRSMPPLTPEASDKKGPARPKRSCSKTYRILRDTTLGRGLKDLHDNQCQLCGHAIELTYRDYSEAHHIMPLGRPHDGPDVAENILVLCPNHHAMCDYGAIELRLADITQHAQHLVGEEYIEYHNTTVFPGRLWNT